MRGVFTRFLIAMIVADDVGFLRISLVRSGSTSPAPIAHHQGFLNKKQGRGNLNFGQWRDKAVNEKFYPIGEEVGIIANNRLVRQI